MKRWRTVLWALLLVLPGGLWILGAAALVNAVRRHRAGAVAPSPAGLPPDAGPFAAPQAGDGAVSTWV